MSDYGINIGSRRSRNVITPTFSRDFIANNTLNHGVGPDITFTRASSATFFTSTGILSTVLNNVPRFDHGNFRTNYIWNSTFAGAVAGNPGTLPSNGWVFQDSNRGIAYIIKSVGIDSELGLPFMEIQLSGANTIPGGTGNNASLAIYPLSDTQLQVLSGQTWTTSVYFKTIAGSLSGNNAILYNFEVGSPAGQSITSFAPTTNWQRISNTRTMSITSEPRFLRPAFALASIAPSDGIDYTFRIAAPQTELSSVATAFIPTTNAPATTGVPLGLLIELSRTNSIRNAQAGSSIPGVIGSVGAMPTYWTAVAFGFGLSAEVVASGTEAGLSYVDVRFYGTNSSGNTGVMGYYPEFIAASPNQTWTGSHYVKLQAGSTSGVDSFATNMIGRKVDQTGTGDTTAVTFTPSASLQRVSATRALGSADTALVSTDITMYVLNGQSIDLTLRLAAPQLEQGSFPTSYIPTTTLSATRQADVAQITSVTSFVNQSQGTLFSEFRTGPGFPVAAAFILDADAIGDRVGIFASGVTQIAINNIYTNIDTFSPFTNTIFKAALGYKAFNHASTINGRTVQGNTAIGVPINLSYLRIGCEGGSGFTDGQLSGHVRKVTYWPTKLSNNRLRLITS